ncbi:choice-of-anchor D domain-containing protein [Chloroflexota bacterium]
MSNSIIWGNTDMGGSAGINAGTVAVTYSNVQGGHAGTGNISADPLFVNAGGEDFHLQSMGGHWTSSGWVLDTAHSPCIDAGDPASAFNNEPVRNGGRINMGAYGNTAQASKCSPITYYVNDGSTAGDVYCTAVGNDANDGMSPTTPKLTIQAIIDTYDLEAGDIVYVDAGTYVENIVIGAADSGLTIQGAGAELSIIDGNNSGPCLNISNVTSGTVTGLTIQSGNGEDHSGALWGGGIYCSDSNITISDNTIRNNIVTHSSTAGGGGISTLSSTVIISNNVIYGNSAKSTGGAGHGGGILSYNDTSVSIVGNTISDNSVNATFDSSGGGISIISPSAGSIENNIICGNSVSTGSWAKGGGIYTAGTSATISGNSISGNKAIGSTGFGGGIQCYASPALSNNAIIGNTASWGGGVFCSSGTPIITNNTLYGNAATESGHAGGIENDTATPSISNNILWGNGDEMLNCTVSYTCTEDDDAGTGNMAGNPLFAGGTSSTWTSDATYSSVTGQSTIGNVGAAWTPGALAGLFLNPNTSQNRQFAIAGNTATSLTVWGDVSTIAQSGDTYQLWDFHLQSQAGHWTSSSGWVLDAQTSPCIDMGDPLSTCSNEPVPNGGRINMGTYGNTSHASKSAPEMNLKEGVTDIADGDVYDFGSHLLNTNTDVTFTIENTGTADLTLTLPLTIVGADAGQFSVQTQPTSPVVPSGSTTFTVRFTPTSTGAKTATMSIANNDSDESPYDLTIQGTATAPEINLKEGATDIADDGVYDFGSQLLSTDTDVTFTIENAGTGSLTLTTPLTIGGADADQFSIQSQPTSPVAAAGSTTFTVRFTPTSVGAKTATISIVNNDIDENPYDLTITGTGFEEEDDHYLDVNLLDTGQRVTISDSGRLRQTLEVTSADGKLTVNIPSGTRAKQENGNRLTTLDVSENDNPPPPPENKNIIGLTYSFEPSGATFDPPITLTFTYNHIDIPEGVSEEDLILAFYDEDTGKWIELECVVDIDNHTINAMVSHFTDFAIIAPVQQSPPTTPQPEPSPAAFSLSRLTIQPLEVEPEEMVTISVSVTNTGGTKGSYTVVLNANDIEEQRQSISIAASGTEQVDFTVNKEDHGDYSIKIGSLKGTFTEPAETPVEEAPQQPELPTEPSVPTEKGGINWYIIGTILGVAILLAIFIPVWIRSRREG